MCILYNTLRYHLFFNFSFDPSFESYLILSGAWQERVGGLVGSIEFLELCGFEKIEGGEFLLLQRDKVDMALLNSAGTELNSAINNPFFGVL